MGQGPEKSRQKLSQFHAGEFHEDVLNYPNKVAWQYVWKVTNQES